MERLLSKRYHRTIRKRRVRKKIHGSASRPRITGYRSNQYLFVQAINDDLGSTTASVHNFSSSSSSKPTPRHRNWTNCDGAFKLGKQLGETLLAHNINNAVFDCNGYRYHGIIKSLADGVRDAGVSL